MASSTRALDPPHPLPAARTDNQLSSTSPTSSQRPSLRVSAHSTPETTELAPAPTSSSPAASSGSGANTRPFSHSRSQSMSDHPPSSPPATSLEAQPPLVRRHHTLSSSAASRLVKQERSRVRLALQGVGLSEEDQHYYVPESPVRSGPMWSDAGHASGSASSLGGFTGSHSRSMSGTSSAAASWGGSEPESLYSTPFYPLPASPASQSSFDPPSLTKRSSFVVLRGSRGEAELTERRKSVSALPPPSSEQHTPPRPGPEHRNSLKPFLEAELGEEEWERGLLDERDKEELELRKDDEQHAHPFAARPSPPLSHSSSFHTRVGSPLGSHTRASTFSHSHQQSIGSVAASDAWLGDGEEAAALRRRQSLNNFRQEESSPSEPWSPHARATSEEQLLSSLALSSAGFSRSRSGTGPPSLNLSHGSSTPHSSLSHSNSLSSHHSHHGHGSSLSHSNSLSSHGHSQLGNGGALSPVGGFPRSPWSPTVEETKQLGMGAVVGSSPQQSGLSRGGSGSSRGSVDMYGDEIGRLGEEMAVLEMERNEVEEAQKSSTLPRGETTSSTDSAPRPLLRSLSSNGPSGAPSRRLPPLMTNPDVLASLGQPKGSSLPTFLSRQGPASAAAFVPPIGHSHAQLASQPRPDFTSMPSITEPSRGNFTAAPGAGGADWLRQKELLVGSSPSTAGGAPAFSTAVGVNPAAEAWPTGGGFGVGLAMQQQQQIQVLQSQMQQAMQAMDMMKAQGVQIPPGFGGMRNGGGAQGRQQGSNEFPPQMGYAGIPARDVGVGTTPSTVGAVAPSTSLESPIDIPSLIATKGYNPPAFELRPPNARFFVIKSYTEEDVHKSLKYEIWASTDLGNKRLDRAFRESADKGPLYLFFSVNGSGHFAGMAQMLTPVDYAMSSNVWASDKWKGVLKVRWIYIKDVPLASLRHIRLSNTPENKPVTSSRDTQEVPYEQGCEVLRILSSYQSRTSLLQDFAWYEARQEAAQTAVPGSAPPAQPQQVPHQPHYAARPPPPQHQPQQQQQQQQQHPPQQQQHQPQQHQPQHQHQQQYQHPQMPFNGPPAGVPPTGMVGNAHGGGRRFFSGGGGGGGMRGGPGAVF